MDITALISIILLGLSGTGHCIGMCGPLVLAFPARTGRFSAHLLYHAGRITTYTAVGALMGSLGLLTARVASVTGTDYLALVARIQVGFSLLAGGFLFVFGLSQLGVIPEPDWFSIARPDKIPGYKRLVRSAFQKDEVLVMFLTGMMMGLLPCGLSFAAFSRALAASSPQQGAFLLLAFGFGTLPGLLLIGTSAVALARRYGRQFDLLSGMLMMAMAACLIVEVLVALL